MLDIVIYLSWIVIGAVGLVSMMRSGVAPGPGGMNGERHGDHPGLFWITVMLSVGGIIGGVFGLAISIF
ncbi:hypothetical protein [Parerythrobacter lacustris]|uniref:GlsB/YeaQ/YmgE family stress response membrane protein n=1 Tax=Parerythrobacter lacustris TaxID=2969984 RepID=A0ABT1XSA9_9SPHN|nr:hypothetical protein [Parerythrobacter lacustris]MCR2833327.1 hypothetical protein [Parerythrobacter lacustris]